jgi:hypothetical protein
VEIVLDAVARALPQLQLSAALDRIDSKLELKKTRKLFTEAKEDIKTYEQLRPITLEKFVSLAKELTKEQKPQKSVDNISTLLFYAK